MAFLSFLAGGTARLTGRHDDDRPWRGTYGVLPDRDSFYELYARAQGGKRYRISNVRDVEDADGEYTDVELYKYLRELVERWENGDDAAGDLASSILSTLNAEWI